jgi:hypothetical protein
VAFLGRHLRQCIELPHRRCADRPCSSLRDPLRGCLSPRAGPGGNDAKSRGKASARDGRSNQTATMRMAFIDHDFHCDAPRYAGNKRPGGSRPTPRRENRPSLRQIIIDPRFLPVKSRY